MSHLTSVMPSQKFFGTPQNRMATPDQIPNAAGGFTFKIDPFEQLNRFLILGTEGGTFYSGEHELTIDNARALQKLLQDQVYGMMAVDRIVAISDAGRAVKNDTCLFALAMASGLGTPEVKAYALSKLSRVARTGSHILMFAKMVEQFRGWGRGLKNAVAHWYLEKDANSLAYQVTKYQNRNGYTQRDLLRLSHPNAKDNILLNNVLKYAVGGEHGNLEEDMLPPLLVVLERIKANPNKIDVNAIRDYNLAREVLPTEWLQKAEVWEALLENMPMTAMVRNLATMTRLGLLTENSAATQKVVAELTNADRVSRSRIHPMSILIAAKTYNAGRGLRGSNTWIPSNAIVRGLDRAFYLAYGNVEPSNKRLLLALDLSGSMSMGMGGNVMGIPGFTPREATAALALIQVNTEPNAEIMGFSAGERRNMPLQIAKDQSLERVVQYISTLPSGGTDLTMPVVFARNQKAKYDGIVIYTDNETWAGINAHPFEAMQAYRNSQGLATKLATVSVTATANTVTNPKDPLMGDFIGFDTSTPAALSEFLKG